MHRISISGDTDISPFMADRKLLRQMFNNLITNAVKYSPMQSEIHVRVKERVGSIVVEVSDHGIGIPDSDLEDLFQPFHRAANSGDAPGTGLGLAIVKRAADLHGASVSVESEVGLGSTFRVEIFSTVPELVEAE